MITERHFVGAFSLEEEFIKILESNIEKITKICYNEETYAVDISSKVEGIDTN